MTITTTPNLNVRLMASNDIQKEVVFNEAAVTFDALVSRVAISQTNTPPTSPSDGDTYIVGTAPTGLWAGYTNNVAFYYSGWRFVTPFQQLMFYLTTPAKWYTYSGSGWVQNPTSSVVNLADLGNVSGASPTNGYVLTYVTSTNKWTPLALPNASQLLSGLNDVTISSPASGQVLTYDHVSSKWLNENPSVGATDLTTLTDVNWTGEPSNGYILTWDTGTHKAHFVAQTAFPMALGDLTNVTTTGALANDSLVFNGSAWGPSSRATTFSFAQMVDGPGTLTGNANKFLVVDSAETSLVFETIGSVVGALGTILLQNLGDVPTPTSGEVGQSLRLKEVSGVFSYEYYTPTNYSLEVLRAGTELTANAASINFVGFQSVTDTSDAITVTAIPPIIWENNGTVETGITTVNILGSGANVTVVGGNILTVDIAPTFSSLPDKPDLRALYSQSITANSSTLNIDLSLGENVIISLAANVSTMTFSNPLGTGKINRVILEVHNTGSYNITNWAGALWTLGAPTVTPGSGKIDRFIITSFDGMTTKLADVIGQNYH